VPHILIDYSSGANEVVDMARLVEAVHRTARSSGHFAPNVVRTLARGADYSLVADENPLNQFVQITIRMAPGRSREVRKAFSQAVFDAASTTVPEAWSRGRFALRVDVTESDPELSSQRNLLPKASE
jgi:5-carboxymethyl-2-hydroxymuconate isomerase